MARINENELSNIEIMKYFEISKTTFYKLKNEASIRGNSKPPKKKLISNKRNTKITNEIKNYIVKYALNNINFNRLKLISLINKKFGILISKTSIYTTLANKKIRKKKSTKKFY